MSTIRCPEHKEIDPILVRYPKNHYQYAAWRCASCQRWLTHAKWPRTTEELQKKQKEIRDIIFSSPACNQDDLHNLLMHYQIINPNMKQLIEFHSLTVKLRAKNESDDEEE